MRHAALRMPRGLAPLSQPLVVHLPCLKQTSGDPATSVREEGWAEGQDAAGHAHAAQRQAHNDAFSTTACARTYLVAHSTYIVLALA